MVKNNGRGGRGYWYRIIVGMMMVLDTSKGGMVKNNGRGGMGNWYRIIVGMIWYTVGYE